ncbi:hypothetical protein DRJ16_04640 [Candidatus Woesearchaeota archaeon]|nr:MAG: hypothetical protein DRJ16_04640 [Candidatus Woesearchaeota archaeon]
MLMKRGIILNIDKKGRLTIPSNILKWLGDIKPETPCLVMQDRDVLLVKPLGEDVLDRLVSEVRQHRHDTHVAYPSEDKQDVYHKQHTYHSEVRQLRQDRQHGYVKPITIWDIEKEVIKLKEETIVNDLKLTPKILDKFGEQIANYVKKGRKVVEVLEWLEKEKKMSNLKAKVALYYAYKEGFVFAPQEGKGLILKA